MVWRLVIFMADGQSSSLDYCQSSPLDGFIRSLSIDMDTFGERLKKALAAKGETVDTLAAKVEPSRATLFNIQNGTTQAAKVRGETVDQICKALGISKDWLRTGRGSMDGPDQGDPDWPDIAAYRQAASLGDGAVPDEYAETHALKFRADSLRRKRLRPASLGVVYGKGDSMLPRIRSGDAILFDRADRDPRDGQLYVITYDGELLAKRLSLLGGRWFVESLNGDDPKWRKPKLVDELKQFEIHGRVRWIGSWED